MGAKFGVAGNGELFYKEGYKASEDMPKWLSEFGLDAYEYQCGNGVRIGGQTAEKIGKNARENGILMSVHSPYYINLATPEEEKREKSIDYIVQSLRAANSMGAGRVVIHSGALGKMTRSEALEYAKLTVGLAVKTADELGFGHIRLCIETMGKINQLGNLSEVMELCKLDERLLPTIDFGHLNARTLGGLKTYEDFLEIFDTIENELGRERLENFHSHFSKIEYTKGGEKRHLTFADNEYGPEFEHVAEITAKKGLSPVFICESAGTQPEDALMMKRMYERIK